MYQSSENSEDQLDLKDGRILELFSYPLMHGEYKFGRVWFFRDVTKQRNSDRELRELQNYLSNIIDSMPSMLVAVDSQINVTQWNNKTVEATGLSIDKARSQPLSKVFPFLQEEMKNIKQSIHEKRVIKNSKIEFKIKNETRFENVTIYPL